ncbi:MAG: tRNA (N6-isopentenyl adenosine(37)-C2)-methylthiotransferase MiaB [Sutterellaceae bacterium]|nr:tRNA (N6-isopentenyl adenosine(37)-C2)-methylthiotransferase MiaB [Sutterellaceae bacterium]MDY2869175.1 tRNA (N6-isopentenyl adenosine(37)-C2)-methylthiotransferase MiaB [Mesosutterella sp.]
MTAKRIYIKSFGCQMNEYDSNRIVDLMTDSDGYVRSDTPENADLIVFNTCSVRDKAQQKIYSELGRIRHLKEENPNLRIAVGGCVASQEGKRIIQKAPYVDVVFGPQTLHRLPGMLDRCRKCHHSQVDVSFPGIEKFDYMPEPHKNGAAAFISIMEGCSKFCTYCVVPYTRGEELSRPVADVLAEVKSLARQGVCEITLLGQNVNAYEGTLPDGSPIDFAMLLDLISSIDGIERIRFMTSHPTNFTDRLIDAFRTNPKIVSHVHLPVQSGSNRVLGLMKRGYTVEQYESIIRRLREARPDVCVTSDFIVGFPGETEEDFEETMRLIDRVKFDASFSFVFSPRPGTPAADMKDETPKEVKLARLQRLQRVNDAEAERISGGMVGTIQRVLVTGASRKGGGMLAARTDNNRVVNFEGPLRLLGQMVEVEITDVRVHTLGGKLRAGN